MTFSAIFSPQAKQELKVFPILSSTWEYLQKMSSDWGKDENTERDDWKRDKRQLANCSMCARDVIVFCYLRLRSLPSMKTTQPLFLTITRKQHLQKYSVQVYSTTDLWCYFAIEIFATFYKRPTSSSIGQSFWLLIMRPRVWFPVLPWEFFLEGEDSHGDRGLCS
jgi:hypothetical protein